MELATLLRNVRLNQEWQGRIPAGIRFQDFGTAEPLYGFMELVRAHPETRLPPELPDRLLEWLANYRKNPVILGGNAKGPV